MTAPDLPAAPLAAIVEDLLGTDALTGAGRGDGTPDLFNVHVDDVPYLVQTVLRLATAEATPGHGPGEVLKVRLRCLNCGAGLAVREADPRGDLGNDDRPTGIECDADCGAQWDRDGQPQ